MQFVVVAALVVNVLPTRVPPHPLTLEMFHPESGVTVNDVEQPLTTVCVAEGVIQPPVPADVETV